MVSLLGRRTDTRCVMRGPSVPNTPPPAPTVILRIDNLCIMQRVHSREMARLNFRRLVIVSREDRDQNQTFLVSIGRVICFFGSTSGPENRIGILLVCDMFFGSTWGSGYGAVPPL